MTYRWTFGIVKFFFEFEKKSKIIWWKWKEINLFPLMQVKELTICYGTWKGEFKEFLQQPLWKLSIIVLSSIDLLWLIKTIAHWPPLYAKIKSILIKFSFYIYNQQLSFTLTIFHPYYPLFRLHQQW
jgi:hypothetical protein